MSTISNKALQGLKLAFNILREFTDPAWEGNPYLPEKAPAKSMETKKVFSFKKKFAWR